MKIIRVVALTIFIWLLVIALPCHAQNQEENLAGMYKNYFRLLIDKDFTTAWDALTDESKVVVADLISKEAQTPPGKVLTMLNTNEDGLRDKYFTAFRDNIGELLGEIYGQGIYKVKTKNGNNAVITIEVEQDPKDFTMVRQNGKWKINFFKDLIDNP
ncbi:MAG: hypothetical protein ACYDHW_15940 [Syntrophorhabdaceae bacterium]